MAGNSFGAAGRCAWIVCGVVGFWLSLLLNAAEPQSPEEAAPGDSSTSKLLADVPDARIEAGLLTIAPGDIYWQRFGHNAIVLRDRRDPSRAVAVNYGIFDFGEKDRKSVV